MSHARDIVKDIPEAIFVVWTEEADGAEGSYRIYWSTKHAMNWLDKQREAGRTGKIIEYPMGKKIAGDE